MLEDILSQPIAGVGLELDSWTFLAFACLAILTSRMFGSFGSRKLSLFLFNLVFLGFFFDTWRQVFVIAGFLLATYLIGRSKEMLRPVRIPAWSAVSVVGLWAFLFLIKEPDVLTIGNPFYYYPVKIIGISYLVFRGITYVMEIEQNNDRSPLNYLNFMLFFPVMISGPIERFTNFQAGKIDTECDLPSVVLPSLHRIANGVIKKYVFAENLMPFGIFSVTDPDATAVSLLWLGGVLMLFIIYLDFSGYCDIVIGVARLMGYKTVENFDRPFSSRNVQEFWTRWHMSLGSVIQFYVFAPLTKVVVTKAGRRQQFRIIVFIYFLSMILVALWHGLAWGFFVFGAMHGMVLAMLQVKKAYKRKIPAAPFGPRTMLGISRAATYLFVSLSLILWFSTLDHAFNVYSRMLGF